MLRALGSPVPQFAISEEIVEVEGESGVRGVAPVDGKHVGDRGGEQGETESRLDHGSDAPHGARRDHVADSEGRRQIAAEVD